MNVMADHWNGTLANSIEPLVDVFVSPTDSSQLYKVVFDSGQLSEEYPLANWSVGFGARTGETVYDLHVVDNLRVVTGAAFRKRTVPVEVSINGQEHTSDTVSYSYYSTPTVSYLNFERGPVLGGTSV